MTEFQVEMLGGLRVTLNAQTTVRFRTRRAGLLLAALALAPRRRLSRVALCERLWPDWPDDDAGAARVRLRQELVSVYRTLGREARRFLCADRDALWLAPAAAIDVLEFERAVADGSLPSLTHAVETLYVGELLPGEDAEWVWPERERLAERHRDALRLLAACQLKAGEWERAEATARRAVAADSASEDACALLLRALYARGEPHAVRQAFAVWSERLRREWDDVPTPSLSVLAERLTTAVPRVFGPDPTIPPPENRAAGGSAFPNPLTRFFGREEELAGLAAALDDGARLLTVTGTGGIGKTRLALEWGRRLASMHRVWFVPLADVSVPERVADAVAGALGIERQADGSDLRAECVRVLSLAAAPILILDNAEHLADAVADFVSHALAHVPALVCLTTSRQRLDLSGEREWLLGPLTIPGDDATPESLRRNAAVALFTDRARSCRPDFPSDAPAVAALVARLEGIPLALELAAARAATLTPREMLAALDNRLAFLSVRRRDLPARHQTLRAAIAWSFDLLSPELQTSWAGLSVFRGGWTRAAAEGVTGMPAALQTLECLRERSLTDAQSGRDGTRFRLLETLREFGDAQLTEQARRALRERHAAYFAALAEDATRVQTGPEFVLGLECLEAERDNFRAAQAFVRETGDSETALRLIVALHPFWLTRGYLREATAFCESVLPRARACGGYPAALAAAGQMAQCAGQHPAARRYWQELQMRGDDAAQALAVSTLGNMAHERGDLEAAARLCADGLTRAESVASPFVRATCLYYSGNLMSELGDFEAAALLFAQGLPLAAAACDDRLRASFLLCQGYARFQMGDGEESRRLLRESLINQRQRQDLSRLHFTLECLAHLADAECDRPRIATLLGAAQALRDVAAYPMAPLGRAKCRELVSRLQKSLGPDAFAAAFARGVQMSLAEAVAFALA